MTAKSFPSLQLVIGRMPPARISRSREFLSDGNDDLVVVINREQPGKTTNASALRALRLRTAKDFTARNSGNRQLNIVRVARALGLTLRSLQRLFEADGTTFSEYLLKQRLARAYRMLSDLEHADLAVSAIAYDAGFGDLSYFNRSFRRVYGYTPRDVRGASVTDDSIAQSL